MDTLRYRLLRCRYVVLRVCVCCCRLFVDLPHYVWLRLVDFTLLRLRLYTVCVCLRWLQLVTLFGYVDLNTPDWLRFVTFTLRCGYGCTRTFALFARWLHGWLQLRLRLLRVCARVYLRLIYTRLHGCTVAFTFQCLHCTFCHVCSWLRLLLRLPGYTRCTFCYTRCLFVGLPGYGYIWLILLPFPRPVTRVAVYAHRWLLPVGYVHAFCPVGCRLRLVVIRGCYVALVTVYADFWFAPFTFGLRLFVTLPGYAVTVYRYGYTFICGLRLRYVRFTFDYSWITFPTLLRLRLHTLRVYVVDRSPRCHVTAFDLLHGYVVALHFARLQLRCCAVCCVTRLIVTLLHAVHTLLLITLHVYVCSRAFTFVYVVPVYVYAFCVRTLPHVVNFTRVARYARFTLPVGCARACCAFRSFARVVVTRLLLIILTLRTFPICICVCGWFGSRFTRFTTRWFPRLTSWLRLVILRLVCDFDYGWLLIYRVGLPTDYTRLLHLYGLRYYG